MEPKSRFLLLLLLLAAMSLCVAQARMFGKSELDFSAFCSEHLIPPGSSFWQSLNMTLTDVIYNTPNATNLSYTAKHGRDDATAYSQGTCFAPVAPDVCQDCLNMLVKRAWAQCSGSIAAILILTGQCEVRYQDIPIGSSGPPLKP